mgnify:CR=1 FL=1|jgi:hypothetical protein
MAKTPASLRKALQNGARANKYNVNLNVSGEIIEELVKATSFPEKTIGQVEVFAQGRKVILHGDTEFTNTWDVTFYLDEDHSNRKVFLEWMTRIDDYETNVHANVTEEMVDMLVTQADMSGDDTVSYKFKNCFPSNVGSVDVADDTNNTISEFTVTFSFDNWEIV